MIETNSDESLRELLRLLIDDIVEDPSRSSREAEARKSDGFMPLGELPGRIPFSHSGTPGVQSKEAF